MGAEIPLEDHICFALYGANHAMNRIYQPLLQEFGLTYPQYVAIMALRQEGEMTVGALGRILGLESNTLTPLLKRLEAAGLVSRKRSTGDERQVIVSLTGEGQALYDRTRHVPDCIFEACGMPEAELRDLQGRIRRLQSRLSRQV